MPLSSTGKKVLANMKREYGSKKGENVFYATMNKKKKKGDWEKSSYDKSTVNMARRML